MFDFELIPESILHDAVITTLGDRLLVRRSNGYNFRCPVCGDSRSRPHEKNAWVLNTKGHWQYHCFKGRCGYSKPFITFLREYHPTVYNNVIFHAFSDEKSEKSEYQEAPQLKSFGTSYFDKGELIPINGSHPLCIDAMREVRRRKIPESVYKKWYVAIEDEQYNFENNGKGNKYKNRIIIPYYKFNRTWSYFTGRDLTGKHIAKYMNATGDKEIYNIEFLDSSKPFFITEGPIDSCFIKNSIAMSGISSINELINQIPQIKDNWDNAIFITDNYNIDQAASKMRMNLARSGFQYFNWDSIENNQNIKDINDLVLSNDSIVDANGFVDQSYLTHNIIKPKLGIECGIQLDDIIKNIKVGI